MADAELDAARPARPAAAGASTLRVASEAALRGGAGGLLPDVILSDFSMPGFSGQEALKIADASCPRMSHSSSSPAPSARKLAIDALKRGATDYVLKDNLRRLPSAIERALDIARRPARALS